jgi:hypothetical protein
MAAEVDVEGELVCPSRYADEDGKTRILAPRFILSSEHTKASIARGNLYYDRRTRFGRQLSKQIEIAARYERERAAAIDRSGLSHAKEDLYFAAIELEKIAYGASEISPLTSVGVLIQAHALSAYAEAEIEMGHHRGRSAQIVGLALAQSVSRLAVATQERTHHDSNRIS